VPAGSLNKMRKAKQVRKTENIVLVEFEEEVLCQTQRVVICLHQYLKS
jgi:hypothetical protein